MSTEIWNMNDGTSFLSEPILTENQFAIGIGLFLVKSDFCNNQ